MQGVYNTATVGCKEVFGSSSAFIAESFRGIPFGDGHEHVVVGAKVREEDPDGGGFFQRAYARSDRFDEAVKSGPWYFCGTTTSAEPDPQGRVTRKDHELCRTHVIVADDVGTKVGAGDIGVLLPRPTYVLETSRGNFQYGWVLEEPVSADVAGSFYRGMKECGLTDGGSAKVGQPFRLPGSLHRSGWNASLRIWRERVSFSDMCRRVPLIEGKARNRFDYDDGWDDYQPGDEKRDLIYCELRRRGLIVGGISRDGWVNLVCPGWRDHSNGNRIAGYRIGGGFHCFHEHCAGRGWGDLVSWLGRTQP